MKTKKIVKIFASVLAFISLLVGSNILPPKTVETVNAVETKATTQAKLLYGFETQNEVSNCMSRNSFGKVKLSDEHVTSGQKSMYIEVTGTGFEDEELHLSGNAFEMFSANFFYLITAKNKEFQDAMDMSDYDTFMLDVYNDSDRDTSITVVLQTNAGGKYAKLSGSFHELGRVVLPKGKASHIEYDIAKYQYCSLDTIQTVYFVFDRIQPGQEPLKLYMDSLAVMTKDENFKIDFPSYSSTSNLVCSFETPIEATSFYTESFGVPVDQFPKYELSTTHVTEGNYSLKVTLPATNYYCRCTQWNAPCLIYMNQDFYMKGYDMHEFARSQGKTIYDYYLVFDISYEGSESSIVNICGDNQLNVSPGNSYEVKLELIDEYPTGKFEMAFGFTEARTMSAREFYFDNIRFVLKSEYGE